MKEGCLSDGIIVVSQGSQLRFPLFGDNSLDHNVGYKLADDMKIGGFVESEKICPRLQ